MITDFNAQGGHSSEALDRAAFTTGSVEGRRRPDEYGFYDLVTIAIVALPDKVKMKPRPIEKS
jgi:hypothetical protein